MTEPTHILLIPIDDNQDKSLARLAEQARDRLPAWIKPVFVPTMRGNAVLIPIAGPPESGGIEV
jgi:hypothetical protein